jgi:cytidine deaminase
MIEKNDIVRLYEQAVITRRNSYSPYSKFKVGAALLLDDDKIITGTNVENSSYGLACCAERNALFTAIGQGYKKENIKAILVVANTDGPCSPCGACRQVISELMDQDADVILTNRKNDMKLFKVKDLLPFSFSKDDLNV